MSHMSMLKWGIERIGGSRGSLQIVEAGDGAGQEAASQRAVWHNANSQLSAGRDHLFLHPEM